MAFTCTPATRRLLLEAAPRPMPATLAAAGASPAVRWGARDVAAPRGARAGFVAVQVDHGAVAEPIASTATAAPVTHLPFTTIAQTVPPMPPAVASRIPALRFRRDGHWRLGFKAGTGYGGVPDATEFQWQPGARTASAFVTRRITEALDAQLEITLRQSVGRSVIGSTELTLRADDWAMPILARYALPGLSWAQPFVLGGPAIVFQSRCALRFATSGLVSTSKCSGASSNYRPLSVGVDAGAGVEAGTKATTIVLEARVFADARRNVVPAASARRPVSWSLLLGFSTPWSARLD